MCGPDLFSQTSFDMDMYLANTPVMENLPLSDSVEIMHVPSDNIGDFVMPRDEPPKFSAADVDASVELCIEEQLKLTDKDYLSEMNQDRDGILEYLGKHLSVAVCHDPKRAVAGDPALLASWEALCNQVIQDAPTGKVPISTDYDEEHGSMRQWLVYDQATARERRPFLHEFIRLLLDKEQYRHIAEYLDRHRGIFKLHAPKEVAKLWKQVKGRNSDTNMTYDKLARAIRYYYGNGIMHSNPGHFTFRFGAKSGFRSSWFPGDSEV